MNRNATPETSVDEQLSEDLGVDDITFIEAQVRFRLDLARMQRGEVGELGYVLMDRQNSPNAVIVFDTVDEAKVALDEHPLIESLTAEDCLDASVPERVTLADIRGKEIILP